MHHKIKTYIKMLLHVSVNKPSSGSLLPCYAKVMIIKKSVKIRRYEFSSVVWLHNYPVLNCVCAVCGAE